MKTYQNWYQVINKMLITLLKFKVSFKIMQTNWTNNLAVQNQNWNFILILYFRFTNTVTEFIIKNNLKLLSKRSKDSYSKRFVLYICNLHDCRSLGPCEQCWDRLFWWHRVLSYGVLQTCGRCQPLWDGARDENLSPNDSKIKG